MAEQRQADGSGALAGLRVLELGSMLAGPFVGTLLADFGADVIKVEKPGKPDPLREWPPHKDGVALWWKSMARGKRTVTLDISKPEGRDVALQLIGHSDIVIENFRPGTLERWGLGPDALREDFPQTIWIRVSGYGQTGPYKDQGGYATIAEGFSGLASFAGFPDRGPMVSAFPLGDYLAGVFGAFGAMVALHHRSSTGVGQVVDVSLFEPLFRIIEAVTLRYDQTGQVKPRLGNQMEEDVPRNVYPTADGGYIAVSCGSQRIFENLLDAIDRADLKTDPRFTTMALRVANRDAIDDIVRGWMQSQATEHALEQLQAHHVVAGRIYGIDDVFRDAHYAARNTIASIVDETLGVLRMPAPVPQLSGTPGSIRWTGKEPGADNDVVFRRMLGISSDLIERLRKAEVI
ncbi:CoA transferase [Rhodospirillaceae bacterium SYSU D60014]|uniref:CaiB/BaiF CoA transferase family protein n=1 Tax=Virgifigura deserti TaxID=2268457 RepID=UPI0013C515D9